MFVDGSIEADIPARRRPGRTSSPSTFVDCFFFTDTASTDIYPLSLHDALPIYSIQRARTGYWRVHHPRRPGSDHQAESNRSEEHTSELQSRDHIGCRLLLK